MAKKKQFLGTLAAGERWLAEDWGWSDEKIKKLSQPKIAVALLTVIATELKTLNRLLGCRNFTDIPMVLREIRAAVQTKKRKPRKKRTR